MTYWIKMFQEWQDMQKQFLDKLPFKLPNFNTSGQNVSPWSMPHLQTFMSWGQSAVNQSMELQSHWLAQWANQMESVLEKPTDAKSDMLDRIRESMSGWSENQAELWEYWFKMIEETSDGMDNPEQLLRNLETWKETINESLTAQTECLDHWPHDLNIEELTTDELMDVSQKMKETMNGWLELHGELWHQWFNFLRLNEETPAESKTSNTSSTAKTKTAVKLMQDNIELISGIGPVLAKKLYAQGIVSLKQIAELTDKEIEKLEATVIKFPGRIQRENWISQAAEILNNMKKGK